MHEKIFDQQNSTDISLYNNEEFIFWIGIANANQEIENGSDTTDFNDSDFNSNEVDPDPAARLLQDAEVTNSTNTTEPV